MSQKRFYALLSVLENVQASAANQHTALAGIQTALTAIQADLKMAEEETKEQKDESDTFPAAVTKLATSCPMRQSGNCVRNSEIASSRWSVRDIIMESNLQSMGRIRQGSAGRQSLPHGQGFPESAWQSASPVSRRC